MKRLMGVLVALGILGFVLSSCSSMEWRPFPAAARWRPLAQGELRLLSIQVPETMQANLPYDMAIIFKADGQPLIKKACFRLLAQKSSDSPAATLSCFSQEVEADQQVYTSCRPWESPYSSVSPLYCSNVVSVRYGEEEGERDWFLARIPSEFLKYDYNKLECHAEYVSDGELKESNRISASIRIEK